MTIETPDQEKYKSRKELWQEAFGDSDDFFEMFEKTVYSPDRCRCVIESGKVIAALYWFNCEYNGKMIAYIYAVATLKSFRGRGICRVLMEDTHKLLEEMGYSGTILVPCEKTLFDFYKKLGYKKCSSINIIKARANDMHINIHKIHREEYECLRRRFLPQNGIIQEKENLDFIDNLAVFYKGDDFLLTVGCSEKTLFGIELLGNTEKAPGIVYSLGYDEGTFRAPGNKIPFAMYRPLGSNPCLFDVYFGLAFD